MTLSWPRLTWPAWDARQAGPRRRKMSATSTAGRGNGRALAGHLQQKVERACHLAERVDGDAGVERRRIELLVSEQHLDDADIGLLLQKMGGKAVPQRVNTDTLGNAGALGCHANEPVELAPTHVLSPVAGEQPGLAGMHPPLLTRGAPPFTQYIEISSRLGERMTYRSFLPLPCSTRMTIRSLSMSVSLSDTTSDDRRPVA